MPSRTGHFLVHPALGGLDATTASTVLGLIRPDALTIAENITYDVSGARKKRPGTDRYNTTAVTESGTGVPFTALRDFWRFGTSRTATQKFVATAGTQILKDDGDGVWDQLLSGWGASTAQACITTGQGFAVFSTTNGTDAPQSWDGTTFQALAGTPPTFAFSTYHQRRLWAAGIAATMSQITYSAAGGIETWSGGDSSNLILDEDDGDQVIGLSKTFRKRLYAFKGPNVGSVWEIDGTSVSTYTRNKIIEGAPCVGHNTIVSTPNDIYWMSTRGIHSLITTQNYGDTEETYVSRPIERLFHDLNFSQIHLANGVYHPHDNYVAWAVPESGQTTNTILLVYFTLTKQWAIWRFSSFNPSALMAARNPTTSAREPRLYIGGTDGFVRSGDHATLSDDDGTVAYTAKFRTPVYVRFPDADEMTEKSIVGVRTFFRPKGNYTSTLDVVFDDRSASYTVSMAGSGAVLDVFELDDDTLGGNDLTYLDTPTPERCTALELTYSQAGANQDMEITGWGVYYAPGETNAMERT